MLVCLSLGREGVRTIGSSSVCCWRLEDVWILYSICFGSAPFFLSVSLMRSLYLRSSCCLINTFGTPMTILSSSWRSKVVFLNQVMKLPREIDSSISPKTACHRLLCTMLPVSLSLFPRCLQANITESFRVFHIFLCIRAGILKFSYFRG